MDLYSRYKTEANRGLKRFSTLPRLTRTHIEHLPLPVQNYLIFVGVIDKPCIQNIRVIFEGKIRNGLQNSWMNFRSEQFNFFDQPTRLFFIKASMMGIPFKGLHAYIDNEATMQIKLLSLFKIADARGQKMNQSETVTMFNDMCFLAPASLISDKIKWIPINDLCVKAIFTNAGNTISANLYFNREGELINFISSDRYLSSDGKTYRQYDWETPLSRYKEFNGLKIASYGEAIWKMPGGDFCYGQFNLKEINYNLTTFK